MAKIPNLNQTTLKAEATFQSVRKRYEEMRLLKKREKEERVRYPLPLLLHLSVLDRCCVVVVAWHGAGRRRRARGPWDRLLGATGIQRAEG